MFTAMPFVPSQTTRPFMSLGLSELFYKIKGSDWILSSFSKGLQLLGWWNQTSNINAVGKWKASSFPWRKVNHNVIISICCATCLVLHIIQRCRKSPHNNMGHQGSQRLNELPKFTEPVPGGTRLPGLTHSSRSRPASILLHREITKAIHAGEEFQVTPVWGAG